MYYKDLHHQSGRSCGGKLPEMYISLVYKHSFGSDCSNLLSLDFSVCGVCLNCRATCRTHYWPRFLFALEHLEEGKTDPVLSILHVCRNVKLDYRASIDLFLQHWAWALDFSLYVANSVTTVRINPFCKYCLHVCIRSVSTF